MLPCPMVSGRACVFCGNRPVTLEHVFPRWLAEYLGQRDTVTIVGDSLAQTPYRRYASLSYSSQVKRVCASCNNGWMADLEDAASSVWKRIFTEQVALSLSDSRLLLARWAMKTALMIQFLHRESAVPGSVYKDFYNASRPAPNTLIYVARRTMERMPSGAHSLNSRLEYRSQGKDQPQDLGELYAVTYFIQNVVLQVIGFRLTVKSMPHLDFPQTFQPFVQRVWPPYADLRWPPDNPTMTEQQALQFGVELKAISPGSILNR